MPIPTLATILTPALLGAGAMLMPPPAPAHPPELIATGAVDEVEFDGRHRWAFGGISGIDQFAPLGFIFISDDRAKIDPARAAMADITIQDGAISIGPVWWMGLTDEHKQPFEKNTVDAESIRKIPSSLTKAHGVSGWVWSSEGRVKDGVNPGIFVRHHDTRVDSVQIPVDYLPDSSDADEQTRGIRQNRGFEAITLIDDELIAFPEAALTQDEHDTRSGRQTLRVQRFAFTDGAYTATTQFAYPFGPVPDSYDAGAKSGVPSVLALDRDTMLVLERTEPASSDHYCIRLYLCETGHAPDITGVDALKGLLRPVLPVTARKTLLLEFDTIRGRLPGSRVPNFEGMCLVPGTKTLLLVADNGHGEDGPTVLAALDLSETAAAALIK